MTRRFAARLAAPLVAAAVTALGLVGCSGPGPERLAVEVIASHPHDSRAFTQGLVWHEGAIYESTGLHGASSLRQTELDGTVVRSRPLAAHLFGEGLALVEGELLQLTWQDGLLLRYDLVTFEPTGSQRYDGEGWGLCYDGTSLWMSDGSATLTRRRPDDFAVLGRTEVRLAGKPVTKLNDLECVDGAVYANVWYSDDVLRIDPATGTVTAVIDAAPLRASLGQTAPDAVLNGIASDASSGNFLLTGKLWPKLFEVRFRPARR